jgi:hypothetical protein
MARLATTFHIEFVCSNPDFFDAPQIFRYAAGFLNLRREGRLRLTVSIFPGFL